VLSLHRQNWPGTIYITVTKCRNVIFTCYHMTVFISACISRPSFDNGPRHSQRQLSIAGLILVFVVILATKIASRCRRTLRGEGHSAAGWGIVGSVWLQTAGSKVCSFGQWADATCTALPNVIAGQYTTSHCNCCWSVSGGI